MIERQVYTVAEVRRRLRVDRSTLDTWAASGKGPPRLTLPNGRVRYPADAFETWLEERTNGKEATDGA